MAPLRTCMTRLAILPALAAAVLFPAIALATVVTIPASEDNTLYESATGATSNGIGEYMFTGRTRDGFKRRAVIAFDPPLGIDPLVGDSLNRVLNLLTRQGEYLLSAEASATRRSRKPSAAA